MKHTRPNWNIRKIGRMFDSGQFKFDYPIQRKGGQWDSLQRSLLIHSIISDYPIPHILVLKGEDNVDFVIDGKQRITNILDFTSGVKGEDGTYPANSYFLHEDTPPAIIEGREGEIELGGLYFDELDADIQSEIMGATLQVLRLEDATDEEIEELFFRWNNGTPLTKQQKTKAKMGVNKAIIVNELQNHKFLSDMAQFTPLQRRRSDDETVILQAMMLMSGEPIESLVADKILDFATNIRGVDITDVANAVKDGLDYLYDVNTTSTLFKKLHLPTLLIVAKKAKDDNVDKTLFSAWVDDFAKAIDARKADKALAKTDYKKYTGAGSVKKDKVLGRQRAMLKHFDKFKVKYAEQLEEIKRSEEEAKLKEQAQKEKEKVQDEPTIETDTVDIVEAVETNDADTPDTVVESDKQETTEDTQEVVEDVVEDSEVKVDEVVSEEQEEAQEDSKEENKEEETQTV